MDQGIILSAWGGGLEPERDCLRPIPAAFSPGTMLMSQFSGGRPILAACFCHPNSNYLSRSARILKKNPFRLSFDAAFSRAIEACAMPRAGQEGTWLNTDMISAYKCLHGLGFAHSVEAWADEDLVGGLYGIWLGKAFLANPCSMQGPKPPESPLAGLVNYLARTAANS